MKVRRDRRTVIVIAVLAACLVSCSAGADDTSGGAGGRDASRSSSGPAATDEVAGESTTTGPARRASPEAEKVRDAFAGLQATLDESCTPGSGNCAYFVGRVNEELMTLDAAMKADPKGPGHFAEPLAWIRGLRETLDADTPRPDLETHHKELVGVRDRINVWMQGHPDDYS